MSDAGKHVGSPLKKAVFLPEILDADGMDEWELNVFDVSGDHSEPIFTSSCFPFADAVRQAGDYMAENPGIHARIVIERIC